MLLPFFKNRHEESVKKVFGLPAFLFMLKNGFERPDERKDDKEVVKPIYFFEEDKK